MSAASSFDPFTEAAIDDPYPQYAWHRAHDPVHWSPKLRSWVLFRHDDVAAFFRDDTRLSSNRTGTTRFRGQRAPEGAPAIRTVSSDPPAHTPVRAILNATLNARVRRIGPRVETVIVELLEALERADGEVDLVGAFAHALPIAVIAALLGVPEPDRAQFEEYSRAVARGMDRFYAGDEVGAGLREIGAYFLRLVGERRGGTGDDLVHDLLGASHHGDTLTDLEVVALCTALVFGGHETTVNLIGNAMLALLRDREALEALRDDAGLAGTAVEEFLRHDSPAQLISRTAAVELELGGRRIAAGDNVLAAIGAANRDPEHFAAPDRLQLARTPNPHLAFGLGTHFCPGAQLSRLEACAAIPALLRRFPGIRPGERAPVRRPMAVLRGLAHLPVRLR